MKNKFILLLFVLSASLSILSCRAIFKGIVAPNSCQRCQLYNTHTNEILWTEEGCGSANVRLEENCQIKAWELSRTGYNICDMDIECETWKQSPDDE
jgi:hypothetical protein